MIYRYSCHECGVEVYQNYPMGEAPASLVGFCDHTVRRVYTPPAYLGPRATKED